jgi:probable addiction module antidote protein
MAWVTASTSGVEASKRSFSSAAGIKARKSRISVSRKRAGRISAGGRVKPSVDYKPLLLESLRNPEHAAVFLNAAVEESLMEDDMPLLLLSLRNVVAAQGGMTKVARLAGLNRENLYRMLSKDGNPEFRRLTQLLGAMGLRISISAK